MSNRRMSEQAQAVARVMEVGGTTAAVGPWLAGVLGFLDHHSQAAMVLCAVIGAATTLAGFVLSWYFRLREDRRQQKEHNALFLALHKSNSVKRDE